MEKILNLLTTISDKFRDIVRTIQDRLPESVLQRGRLYMIIGGAVLLLLAGIGVKTLFFGNKKPKNTDGDFVQVKVQKIKKEDYTDNFTVMGTIKGAVENELRYEIDGVIASYNFREGARIHKGQIICSLDPKDALTKADFARSKYKSEQSLYYSASQRMKVYEDLYRMKAISESKLQEARYETQSAEARMKATLSELELAQLNLAKTNLFAPSDGLLAEILIKPGDYITPQDVIAKYISGGDTNFEVDVPEKDVSKIKIGMKVKVNCDSYPNRDFWGTVREIAPTVKERTRTTTIKVAIPNTDGMLRSGMFGRGSVFLTELQNVILVPSDSIISLGETTTLVPIVKADPRIPNEGIIEMRHVTTGEKLSQMTVISDGLFPDELVVTETQGQLSDGVHVKFTEAPSNREANRQSPDPMAPDQPPSSGLGN